MIPRPHGSMVWVGEGRAAVVMHYDRAPLPETPAEARKLMRAASWCWRRCRSGLPLAALYHRARAVELRDLAKRLEGPLQRDFTWSLFQPAPAVEAHRPKAVTAPGQPVVAQRGGLSRAGGAGGELDPTTAPPSKPSDRPYDAAASGAWTGQG